MTSIKNKKIKLAVPNKGRLKEPTLEILKAIGLDFELYERQLSSPVQNFDMEILYISASNIPEYVQDGVADLGITGYDLVCERNASVKILEKLGYGKTKLVIASPEGSNIKKLSDLNGKKVATTFTAAAKKFFNQNKIKAEVVEVDGAVEITPWLGLVDAIVDLTSSGNTLRMNKLNIIAEILSSETILIGNQNSLKNKKEDISSLLLRFESVLNAKRKRYIMMNAPEEILPKIKQIAPGLSSPTIMKLSKPGMIAVHSVIDSANSWEIVEKLKKIGATGILVMPIEKML